MSNFKDYLRQRLNEAGETFGDIPYKLPTKLNIKINDDGEDGTPKPDSVYPWWEEGVPPDMIPPGWEWRWNDPDCTSPTKGCQGSWWHEICDENGNCRWHKFCGGMDSWHCHAPFYWRVCDENGVCSVFVGYCYGPGYCKAWNGTEWQDICSTDDGQWLWC